MKLRLKDKGAKVSKICYIVDCGFSICRKKNITRMEYPTPFTDYSLSNSTQNLDEELFFSIP